MEFSLSLYHKQKNMWRQQKAINIKNWNHLKNSSLCEFFFAAVRSIEIFVNAVLLSCVMNKSFIESIDSESEWMKKGKRGRTICKGWSIFELFIISLFCIYCVRIWNSSFFQYKSISTLLLKNTKFMFHNMIKVGMKENFFMTLRLNYSIVFAIHVQDATFYEGFTHIVEKY